MNTNRSPLSSACLLAISIFAANAHAATDISSVPLNTYQATSSTDVKPNVLFVLDDSGSMGDDFLPDWASGSSTLYRFRNSTFNGLAYNPAVKYDPPAFYNADGTLNTTTYPSMTGQSATTGGDGTATAGSPNWKAVPDDGYGIQSNTTSNLVNNAFYYLAIPGEFCTNGYMTSCTTATTASTTYPIAAPLRWCNSTALTTCRAAYSSTYKYARMPIPSYSTLTVAASTTSNVTGITVNGQQILSGTANASSTANTFAQNIVNQINLCSGGIPAGSNCTVFGYVASRSGSTVTIYAPNTTTDTPLITQSGATTVTATTFTTTPTSGPTVPGQNLRTTITSSVSSYPYPGTAAKKSNRTDCAGTTCTYAEEMTNYANWWAYYHTRMQMMKTAASRAFSTLDKAADLASNVSRFRVGFLTISDGYTDSAFQNLNEFKTAEKNAWFTKLFASNPASYTPLRAALSRAGQLYAGKLNGTTVDGVTVSDPMQYSCQKNYTILSTDGYWNTDDETSSYGPFKMDGATNVGNQDASLPRPLYDGGSAQIQSSTSNLQSQTVTSQLQQQTSQLQASTSYLQISTAQLQQSTSANSGATWSGWSNVTSCTWDNSGATRTRCQYLTYTAPVNAATCTTAAKGTSTSNGVTWNGPATICSYTAWSAPAGVSSCSALARDTTSPYTIPVATQCNTVVTSAYANAASCTPTTTPDANGYTTQCQTIAVLGTWTNASSCTVSSTQNCQYTAWSAWSNASTCTAVPQSTGTNYTVATAVQCQTLSSGGTSNTLADVAAYYYGTDLRSPIAGNGTGTCTGPVIPPATTASNLCDDTVEAWGRDSATWQHMTTFTLGLGASGAMVYSPTYWDDPSGDFYDVLNGNSANPSSGICSWQTSGACNWPTPSSNSLNNIDDLWHAAINGRGDYYSASDPKTLADSLSGALTTISNTPKPGTAAAAASSNPNVSSSDNYVFSSSYKSVEWFGELIRQQIDVTTHVLSPVQWSAMTLLDCGATTWQASTPYIAGNVYRQGSTCYKVITDYASGAAFGDTEVVDTNVMVIKDTAGVSVTPQTSRTIYTKGTSGLIPFQWNSLSSTQQAYFTAPAITFVSTTPFVGLSQFCSSGVGCLTAAEQSNFTSATGGAAGENLVNFLRGDRSNEGTFYRKRTHILGDIVASEGRYVKQSLFTYADSGHADFETLTATRSGRVYVAANDGMLHAFDASTGQESWAYIPEMVLPNIYKLADKNYSQQHQFFVDGTPEVGDICPTAPTTACTASQWRTILVGGFNLGGKGYYALDITDPANPSLLWEISSATAGFSNLGYSYSNPRITKLKDGTWVVIFASGYNNADGVGRIYIVNASTGTLIRTISTGVGSVISPSGLSRISAHAPQTQTDNTTVAVYGGDLLGNLWRFDINGDIGAAGYDAQLLVSFLDASNNPEPITAKPTVATLTGNTVVYVGTGRFLGTSDYTNTNLQTFYAVKDKLDSTTYGNPRTASNGFVQQTLTAGTCPTGTSISICNPGDQVRLITSNSVDWTSNNGWYFDFLTGGERSTTDSSLGLGTLVFTTITPQAGTADACSHTSGSSASFSCFVDYKTGGAITGSNNVACTSLGVGLATRPVLIRLPDGTVVALIRMSGGGDTSSTSSASGGTDLGNTKTVKPPITPTSATATRRVSWHELLH